MQSFKMAKIQCIICVVSAAVNYICAHFMIRVFKLGIRGASYSMSIGYFINFSLSTIAIFYSSKLKVANIRFDYRELMFKTLIKMGFFNLMMNSMKWWALYGLMIILGAYLGYIE